MDKFSNQAVGRLLEAVATAYILRKGNRFKILAYQTAADAVDHSTREIKDIWKEGKLEALPGIGKAIAASLDDYFRHGRSRHFDAVLKPIPPAVFKLLDLPGIGPKKAYKLVTALHLKNPHTAVTDLKKACRQNKAAGLPTFGEKSQEEILEAIKIYEQRSTQQERMTLPYAFSLAGEIITYLKKNPRVLRVDALGSLRRMVETIGDIDLAVVAEDKYISQIINHFTSYPKAAQVDNAGGKKASIIIPPNIRVDLRIQEEKSYGSMLQYFTGGKAHNINLREYALKKGLSLSEYGITNLKSKKINLFRTEADFYRFLGLNYIPPEIREGSDEIDRARKNDLPVLAETKDIKGDLHVHSNFDLKPSHDLGSDSVTTLTDRASKLNYNYIGFSDHNPKSSLSESEVIEILAKRKKDIDDKLKGKKIDYFIGLEVDITPDGRLTLPEKALPHVDYLIASIHSVFNLNPKQMTRRVLAALNHPKVRILGHPTGRYFGKREGFQLEWNQIFAACKQNNIALEINAWPERLDLPAPLVREAVNNQVPLIINTDAHDVQSLDNMFYGVAVARRGWAEEKNIVNTFPAEKFKRWLLNV